jgi:NTE family protein
MECTGTNAVDLVLATQIHMFEQKPGRQKRSSGFNNCVVFCLSLALFAWLYAPTARAQETAEILTVSDQSGELQSGPVQSGQAQSAVGQSGQTQPPEPQSKLAQLPNQAKVGQVAINRPKIGLALGGGGVRAAAHVGVLKVLEEEGIPVDMIVGTSTGAVVGGLYSAGMTPTHIEEQFTEKKFMHAFLSVPLTVRVLVIPLFYTPRLLGLDTYDGLYRGNKFAHYLNKQVPATDRDIQDLRIPFGAVAVNLLDGQPRTIRSGNLSHALQASCAIPALRKPVKLDNGLYVDGGVLDNLPVQQTKKMGADLVIAVDIDEKVVPVAEPVFKKFGSVSHRVMTLHYSVIDQDEQAMADFIIHPEVTGVGLISTDSADAKRCVEAGERAARSAVPAIREMIERFSREKQ